MLPLVAGLPFLLAILAPLILRALPRVGAAVLAGAPLGLAASIAQHLWATPDAAMAWSVSWAPSLGLDLAFRLDGLSGLMALLITGIGGLIIAYAGAYQPPSQGRARLIALLLAFMGAMLGVVLSDNLLVLFVFWELTSISSYLLIGFEHEREKARKAALQAMLTTGLGALAMLAGLILLGQGAGTYSISGIIAGPAADLPYADVAAALILVGAMAKSAQFPFHFWLPNAMEAPTPVSAYLHSCTMVKAGVFLLARLDPALTSLDWWTPTLTIVAGLTMIAGSLVALRAVTLKGLAAGSTIIALSMLVGLVASDSSVSASAFATLLLAHALFKAAIFMVAGAITHATHIKDAEPHQGLRHSHPALFAAAILAGIAMVGLPPAMGFVGKELFLKDALRAPWLAVIATLAAACSVFACLMIAVKPFIGPPMPTRPDDHAAHHHDDHADDAGRGNSILGPDAVLAGVPIVLGVLGFALMLPPAGAIRALLDPAARAMDPAAAPASLALWHGLKPELLLSLVALVLGAGLFALRSAMRRTLAGLGPLDAIAPGSLYHHMLALILGLADRTTRRTHAVTLGSAMRVVLIVAMLILIATSIWSNSWIHAPRALRTLAGDPSPPIAEVLASVVVFAAAITLMFARSRLTALASLGIVGLGVAFLFVLFGAPDLAMTQVAVDALMIILFVLAFRSLPDTRAISSVPARVRDIAIAGTVGLCMAALTLIAAHGQFAPPIAPYFGENAVPIGQGRNVVNVILVDFRAYDTLGEITVLGIAGLGVAALWRSRRRTEANP